MISDFERYHGAVLRDLIVCAGRPLEIAVYDDSGRVNSFLIDNRIALHIKHSSKRIPPWSFTFTDENVEELTRLARPDVTLWLALVCGQDGIVAISFDEFHTINPSWAKATSFVRVDRDKRTMYRVFGTNGRLPAAKPRGTSPLIADLKVRNGASR
jgi:hypothetical protein